MKASEPRSLKNVCEHGVQIIKNAEDVKLHRRTSAR
jgi:hypothetical protein